MTGSATEHRFIVGDARRMDLVDDASVGLVVTSPPYWTLKRYADHPAQLGHIADYDQFCAELAHVWAECARVLIPGGRLCVNVADVTLSRRAAGRHHVLPLHANILLDAQRAGLDALTPILWHKRTNLTTEMSRRSYFLGKPYEPNGIIRSEVEYVLMLRKPGAYRKVTQGRRDLSRIAREDYHAWYRAVWTDVTGVGSADHPAPFPVEVPRRLVRMFSFVGDVVLDPFAGSGTTTLAAAAAGRHSVAYDVDRSYLQAARRRLLGASVTPAPHVRDEQEAQLFAAEDSGGDVLQREPGFRVVEHSGAGAAGGRGGAR